MFMGSFGSFAHAAIHPSVRPSPAAASPHCAPGDGVLTALPVLTSSLHSRRSEPCFFTSGLWPLSPTAFHTPCRIPKTAQEVGPRHLH